MGGRFFLTSGLEGTFGSIAFVDEVGYPSVQHFMCESPVPVQFTVSWRKMLLP